MPHAFEEPINAQDFWDDMLIDEILHLPDRQDVCWGGLLQGHSRSCTPGFKSGTNHFKNKLCAACLANGVLVPADRIRALTPSMHCAFANKNSGGLWSSMAGDGPEYRLINQTAKCVGPRLVIFKAAVPDGPHSYGPMPSGWVQHGAARLMCCKGTLVPLLAVKARADSWGASCAETIAAESAREHGGGGDAEGWGRRPPAR